LHQNAYCKKILGVIARFKEEGKKGGGAVGRGEGKRAWQGIEAIATGWEGGICVPPF
jgi:hypothetical protein